MSDRGSGRTARQLAALPDGGCYLVANMVMASHCKRLMQEAGRDPRAIRFVTCGQDHAVEGIRVSAWDVDHAYFDVVGRRGQLVYDLLRTAAFGRPPVSEVTAAAG